MTGEQYYNLDDEVKDRLQRKSYWIFKSKHRWRKIEDRLNCGVVEIERQLDVQIELTEKKFQLMKKLQGEANNAKELDRTNGRRDAGRNTNPNTKALGQRRMRAPIRAGG